MEPKTQRLLHTFAALADLGQEIAHTGDFEEMLRNSFHLLLGSLAIRRGAVGEYNRETHQLKFIAERGLREAKTEGLRLSQAHARELTAAASKYTLQTATGQASRFLEDHLQQFAGAEIEILLPLVV